MKTIIIGASHSGIAAATDLKRLDAEHEVVLIDQRTESELGFISNGINLVFNDVIDDLSQAATKASDITDLGIELLTEIKVIKINNRKKQLKMQPIKDKGSFVQMTYDKLIVATGTSPLIATRDYPGVDNILSYKSIKESKRALEAIEKAQNIAIVGTGYIGLELADSLKKMDKNIYLLEGSQEMLFRYFDHEMVQELRKHVMDSTIELVPWEFGRDYKISNQHIQAVVLAEREIPVDLVIFPDSIYTNVELLENIVDLNIDNTVADDMFYRTSDPNIFAIGDIVPIYYPHHGTQIFMPLVNRAVRMGRAVAMNICGETVESDLVHKTSGAFVFGQFLGSTGLTAGEAPLFGFSTGSAQGTFPLQTKFSKQQTYVHAKLTFDEETLKVLGFQLVSEEFLIDDLNVATALLSEGVDLRRLAIHNFTFIPQYTQPFHYLNELAFQALLERKKQKN
ncbi:FAD-dependent oxidoreductase [Enterococcus dongliensis]|uniref:NAD(P)/FAD-dependent oxidoreductase n=1 Tax=Enterococcus dongliensis TaxID=2559925 RepID=UPI00288C9780|nr:FAD-dependent oxidoreductase [Enterococcus dongliensis]MDT2634781.1 FAD-dependent oxidoreductase [Enterococcus dongliensis]MDT2669238.1 FAD-dependent oxidoreductase [Enterococcus dongliensis]